MTPTIERFRLLGDMILAKPVEMTSKVLVLPRVDRTRADRPGSSADAFYADVVATGPGDRRLHGRCRCGAEKIILVHRGKGFGRCECGSADWEVTGESRVPMTCKPGDRIVIPRRPNGPSGIDPRGDCAVTIDGERLLIFHEEQSALAVVEPDEMQLQKAA